MNKDELNNILEEHNLWLDSSGAEGKRADLRRCNLEGVDLRKADLIAADLRWCNLIGANLREADLMGANLRRSNLRGCNLIGADLREADLMGANLRAADLEGANLRGADLEGAKLDGARLEDIKGKEIISFQAGRHFAYYADGYIKIGCKLNSVDWWLENYKAVGKKEGYTEAEIRRYRDFISYIHKTTK